jgi:hypothetical protein
MIQRAFLRHSRDLHALGGGNFCALLFGFRLRQLRRLHSDRDLSSDLRHFQSVTALNLNLASLAISLDLGFFQRKLERDLLTLGMFA